MGGSDDKRFKQLERRVKELEASKLGGDSESSINNKKADGPKRAPTEYQKFMKTEIVRVKKDYPDLSHKDAFTAAAKGWNKAGSVVPTKGCVSLGVGV